MNFKLESPYNPAGDQPEAIQALLTNISKGKKHQVLLGVTGSGKTFTVANIIQKLNLPTLVISHNKTLAGQLYQEFKEYFPQNAVEYFVSYYDYYQPESYIPQSDTYIEKEADINKEIEKLRLRTTASLMARKDVIVVASVSCIYNLGSPAEYLNQAATIDKTKSYDQVLKSLTAIYYERSSFEFARGNIRVVGENIDVWPVYEDEPVRIFFSLDKITSIYKFNSVTGEKKLEYPRLVVFPAKHYLTNNEKVDLALLNIQKDLDIQVAHLKKINKPLEAYRIEQRTKNDLEMIKEVGFVNGIENYSRYFDGREIGEPPFALLDFLGKEFLLVIDESHITIPQLHGMFNGDRSRKNTLVDYGFRLPSCTDNRPLKFEEFERRMPTTLYTSATPATWEMEKSQGTVVAQLVRPTGIVDPEIAIIPSKNQIADLVSRIKKTVSEKKRTLVTTLTKKMAEEFSLYLEENTSYKVAYLHSDIKTLERSDILDSLRRGNYDVLVGVNLLREGLDLPEVSLVAILDADKEGFLRSKTSLIQTMGRASRNINGAVVMYANVITKSMQEAIDEVTRRRNIQLEYNKLHHITPVSIEKPFRDRMVAKLAIDVPKIDFALKDYEFRSLTPTKQKSIIATLQKLMLEYAKNLEFEKAAEVRDKIKEYKTN